MDDNMRALWLLGSLLMSLDLTLAVRTMDARIGPGWYRGVPVPALASAYHPLVQVTGRLVSGKAQPAQQAQTKETAVHTGGYNNTGYICRGDNGKREEGQVL